MDRRLRSYRRRTSSVDQAAGLVVALWRGVHSQRSESTAILASTTPGPTVVGSATPHVKGSWTQLIASTAFDSDEMLLIAGSAVFTSGVDSSVLLDIGVGGSGSETVAVADIMCGHLDVGHSLRIPMGLSAGSRVAARLQAAQASKGFVVDLTLFGSTAWFGSDRKNVRATTYGVDVATSAGTVLTNAATAHAKFGWTEMVASTTHPIRALAVLAGCQPGITTISTANMLLDVGVGGSGSEAVVVSNMTASQNTSETFKFGAASAFPVSLPAGVRLSVRFQKSVSTAQPPSVTLIGIG